MTFGLPLGGTTFCTFNPRWRKNGWSSFLGGIGGWKNNQTFPLVGMAFIDQLTNVTLFFLWCFETFVIL